MTATCEILHCVQDDSGIALNEEGGKKGGFAAFLSPLLFMSDEFVILSGSEGSHQTHRLPAFIFFFFY
jgi:hypothetical protein